VVWCLGRTDCTVVWRARRARRCLLVSSRAARRRGHVYPTSGHSTLTQSSLNPDSIFTQSSRSPHSILTWFSFNPHQLSPSITLYPHAIFRNELSDPGTTLNDCDCNCGGLDPDCTGNFDNLYCEDQLSKSGTPLPIAWGQGVCCLRDGASTCNIFLNSPDLDQGSLDCPQLPKTAPPDLARGRGETDSNVVYSHSNPPPGWICDSELYFELDANVSSPSCDCGCGVIDPDCGYRLLACDDQSWNPPYSQLTCGGLIVASDLMYCRLESATCQTLPPGLSRGGNSEWKCIPDVWSPNPHSILSQISPKSSLNPRSILTQS
jgi:hypothetical protein